MVESIDVDHAVVVRSDVILTESHWLGECEEGCGVGGRRYSEGLVHAVSHVWERVNIIESHSLITSSSLREVLLLLFPHFGHDLRVLDEVVHEVNYVGSGRASHAEEESHALV
jgi:hypothetical protein